jgi:hypothetical protein
MKRRSFVRGSAGLAAGATLAGCLGIGGSNSPPPRKSDVFADVALQETTLQIQLLSEIEVETRQQSQSSLGGGAVAALLPVGRARAAKGAAGRGTGGYSSAPKHSRHGWAIWHGGAYGNDWRDDHDDELRMADASVATLGVAYLGTDDDYENDAPGPGPGSVSWDETWDSPEAGADLTANLAAISPGGAVREGWYRIGTELVSADGSTNYGWQSVDMEVDSGLGGAQMDKAWYVKPRV